MTSTTAPVAEAPAPDPSSDLERELREALAGEVAFDDYTRHLFSRDASMYTLMPVGVVFRLHGDGAYEYVHPEHKVSCLAEVARSHNAILVAPRTPDRQGEPTWWEDLDGNAEWFLALAEQRIFAEYDLDRSRTWLHGYSGGAEFISYELLADRADFLQGGGAVLSGGGGAPSTGTSEPTQEQLEQLVLHWDVGLEDDGTDPWAPFDALSAATAGHAWYEDAGYERTSVRFREGVDHFELPEARVLEAREPGGYQPRDAVTSLLMGAGSQLPSCGEDTSPQRSDTVNAPRRFACSRTTRNATARSAVAASAAIQAMRTVVIGAAVSP